LETSTYNPEQINEELCIKNLNQPLSNSAIQKFTEDINISDYIICKHEKGRICKCGISFGNEIFCKSKIINELKKQRQ